MSYSSRFIGIILFLFISIYFSNDVAGQKNQASTTKTDSLTSVKKSKINTGYGVQEKKDIIGPVFSLQSEQFNKGFILSPQELFTGKIPGLSVSSNSGLPGSDFTMINRGRSHLVSPENPVIILDGIPLYSLPFDINPNDIESITMIKDGAAAAKFGALAGNGAIIVTTKKGDEKLNVTYAGKLSFSVLPKTISVYSGDEFRKLVIEHYANDPSVLSLPGNANTNWQNEIYQTGIGQDHFLSVSGSVKTIPFRVSLGKTIQNGIVKTSGFNRSSASVNLNPEFFDTHLKLNLSFIGTSNHNTIADENAIRNTVTFDPSQPVTNNSIYGGYFAWEKDGALMTLAPTNPVALLNLSDNTADINHLNGHINMDYSLHFLPEIDISATYGQESYDKQDSREISQDLASYYRGQIEKTGLKVKNKYFDVNIGYSKNCRFLAGKLDFRLGYTNQQSDITYDHLLKYLLSDYVTMDSSYSWNKNIVVSMYSWLNYSFKEKYIFNFRLQRDGSSRYSSDNKWMQYPAVSAAWRVNKENFLKDVQWVSDLTFRMAYSVSGTLQNPITASFTLMDPYLTAEKIKSFNVGADFGFMNDRITGSIEYYRKTGEDLFMVSGIYFTTFLLSNGAGIENKGVEISLNSKIISGRIFHWDLSANLAFNKNEITELAGYEDFIGIASGTIHPAFYNIRMQSLGQSVTSFFPNQQVYDQNGNPIEGVYVDRIGDGGTIYGNLKNRYHYKSSDPKILAGISSDLRFRNWEFGFSGRISLGNYTYNNVESYGVYDNIYSSIGYLNNLPLLSKDANFSTSQVLSDYYVQNASYFRMDCINLGYLFENIRNSKMNINLTASVQNAFVISPYKGQDPEIASGIDYFAYPSARIFMTGISIGF